MRRIEVPVSIALDTLHEMIQAIMPWDNHHMYASYQHVIDDMRWGLPLSEDLDFGVGHSRFASGHTRRYTGYCVHV